MNTVEIPKMEREHVDLEYDLHRLEELNVKYAPTTRELLQNWSEFDKAMDERVSGRAKLLKIRDKLPTKVDDGNNDGINMEEIEGLCKTIEEKDRQLLLGLMHLKDVQLNQKQIDSHGFHPDSKTVSSILVNEVLGTAADQLARDNNYIADDIAKNGNEAEKLRKLVAKYKDALNKQRKQEKDSMDDMML